MALLLLSCDDSVYRYKNQFFAESQEKYDFYQRYLRVFDKLRLVTRCKDESELKFGQIALNDPRIEYIPLPMFQGPKQYLKVYNKIGGILNNICDGCDASILRIPSTVALRIGRYVIDSSIPYSVEVIFDAQDGWRGTNNIIHSILWKRIDHNMKNLCFVADGVSCVTEHYLQKHYYSKKNGSFLSNYSSITLDKDYYSSPRQFPIKTTYIISHVANQVDFNGRKGHNELLKAVKILKEQGISVIVRFAGESYNDGILKLSNYSKQLGIDQQVEFMGYLSKNELNQFLTNSDIFVLPTRAEGLPRVIIEAMAKGLPCVTTNVSGNSELIQPNFLIDKHNNIEQLSNCIKLLLTNKSLYEEASYYNYNQSLNYESSILQARRDDFYSELKNKVK